MRDDLVEEVDDEINLQINLLVRENENEVILQGHLLGPRFHFRALKLHFQFLLFLFGGF